MKTKTTTKATTTPATKPTEPPTTTTAIRAEIDRLESKQALLDAKATASGAAADDAEEKAATLAYAFEVDDDAGAAATWEEAQLAADTARREQRRAEALVRQLKSRLAVLRYTLNEAAKREANDQNASDRDAIILPAARKLDELWNGAMDQLSVIMSALADGSARLHGASLTNAGNAYWRHGVQALRDRILWDLAQFNFPGGGKAPPRPFTHRQQGVSFTAALSGERIAPPPTEDTTAAADALVLGIDTEHATIN